GTLRRRPSAGRPGPRREDARRHAPLRARLELGRIREPDDSDVARARAHRHHVESGRSGTAPADRAGGPAGPDPGSRRRTEAPARLTAFPTPRVNPRSVPTRCPPSIASIAPVMYAPTVSVSSTARDATPWDSRWRPGQRPCAAA